VEVHHGGTRTSRTARHTGGATRIVLCIGGSASIDGGAGLLTGLGFQLLGRAGKHVEPTLAGLPEVEHLVPPATLPKVTYLVVCDVASPLLGQSGGIQRYSGQKGLSVDDLPDAEARIARWAAFAPSAYADSATSLPGGGSAGGVGFAAQVHLSAQFQLGTHFFDELLGLRARVSQCDLVVTGEGRFDEGSLEGKAPVGVATLARDQDRTCILVAGDITTHRANSYFTQTYSLVDLFGDALSKSSTTQCLAEVGNMIYSDFSSPAD